MLLTLKNDVTSLQTGATALREDFSQIQTEIKKIGEVLITQADQNRRILHLEEDFRELRHGRGFIRSVQHADVGIDGEYP